MFFQIKQAGYEVKAKAYAYPIEEMIGRQYFVDYENIEDIFNQGLCKDFIDTRNLKHTKNYKNLKSIFGVSSKEWSQRL